MSNFMQIGDAKNDIVLIENNVSGDQLTTTLTKANGQPISSPPVTLPSSGGTTVVANPTLSGSEAELTGLEVAGTKYSVVTKTYVDSLVGDINTALTDILGV